jgi:peptide-methionine (R)-S-oxide reductase
MDETKAIHLASLTDEQLAVVRDGMTEAPFTGELLENKAAGMYNCIACGTQLFASDAKFDSGSGWPSFDQAIPGTVNERTDTSHGMVRTEVVCAHCGAHLGHVFDDGPKESTGKRFCINSCALNFDPKQTTEPIKE